MFKYLVNVKRRSFPGESSSGRVCVWTWAWPGRLMCDDVTGRLAGLRSARLRPGSCPCRGIVDHAGEKCSRRAHVRSFPFAAAVSVSSEEISHLHQIRKQVRPFAFRQCLLLALQPAASSLLFRVLSL